MTWPCLPWSKCHYGGFISVFHWCFSNEDVPPLTDQNVIMVRWSDGVCPNEDKTRIWLEKIWWRSENMTWPCLPSSCPPTQQAPTLTKRGFGKNNPCDDRDDDQYDNDDDLAKSTLRRSWRMCFGSLSLLRAWLPALRSEILANHIESVVALYL